MGFEVRVNGMSKSKAPLYYNPNIVTNELAKKCPSLSEKIFTVCVPHKVNPRDASLRKALIELDALLVGHMPSAGIYLVQVKVGGEDWPEGGISRSGVYGRPTKATKAKGKMSSQFYVKLLKESLK